MATTSDVCNLGAKAQKSRGRIETRGKGRKGSSRDMVSNMDSYLARVELVVGESRTSMNASKG